MIARTERAVKLIGVKLGMWGVRSVRGPAQVQQETGTVNHKLLIDARSGVRLHRGYRGEYPRRRRRLAITAWPVALG